MGGNGSKIITDYYFKDLNMQRHRKCGLQSGQGHFVVGMYGSVEGKGAGG